MIINFYGCVLYIETIERKFAITKQYFFYQPVIGFLIHFFLKDGNLYVHLLHLWNLQLKINIILDKREGDFKRTNKCFLVDLKKNRKDHDIPTKQGVSKPRRFLLLRISRHEFYVLEFSREGIAVVEDSPV